MKFYNPDISKILIARSFKPGQLIGDNEWINQLVKVLSKKKLFLSYFPLPVWPLNTYNKDISKNITASSLKLGQVIEVDE